MDGRGGCCIARYAGGTAAAYDMSKVDRIMLRFRPIAPKPATGGAVSMLESNSEVCSRSRRRKRRYSKENSNDSTITNNRRYNRKKKVSGHEEKRDGCGVDAMVTLPLLPETPDRKDSPERGSPMEEKQQAQSSPKWLTFDGGTSSSGGNLMSRQLASGRVLGSTDLTVVMPQTVRVMGSCVTVESVTDTWVNGDGLGCTDEEKRKNLERDTCPGFISDGLGRVTWTNGAYREMVVQVDGGEDHQGEESMIVWLVMRERLMLTYPGFTCRVRLQYTSGKERSGLTLPCDVWRMDSGGFAWRLDVNAALSLGR